MKQAASICERQGINGTLQIAILEEPMPTLENSNNLYFEDYLAVLTANYSIDFFNKTSVNYHKAAKIYEIAIKDGYSKKEFFHLVEKFIRKNPYVNFTIANFFAVERYNLHTEAWKKAEYAKNINSHNDMEAFVVSTGEKEVTMYRYFNPDNPLIDSPHVRILNEKWDFGGLYSHQYESAAAQSPKPADDSVFAELQVMTLRLSDANEIITNMRNEKVFLMDRINKLRDELRICEDKYHELFKSYTALQNEQKAES